MKPIIPLSEYFDDKHIHFEVDIQNEFFSLF